jgi:peptidyl-prolyl cis-trans isomerase SurA
MKLASVLLFVVLMNTVFAQEVLDRIVAIVDDEIILESELEFQVNMFATQRGINPTSPELKKQILNSMIDEKLVYAQSELDSIIISDEEIDQRIDYQIQVFQQQYGSLQKIEEMYGMSIEKIKRELRDDVRKNLMVQRMQQTKFASVEATRRDVENFFATFKDSIGLIPEKLSIYHIFKNPKASDRLKNISKDLAQSLLDSIRAGADISVLAKQYSDDPGSAALGGDLGFVKRGVFYPEFEAAAFALAPGEYSEVVESPIGFHIIYLEERRGESIHTKHILIRIEPDEDADLDAIQALSDLRDSVVIGNTSFHEFAKKYSDDEQTSAYGGDLGTFYLNQLDKNLLDIVSKLKEGEISFPRRLEYAPGTYGYHIVYLKERIPQHPASLEEDYKQLNQLANEYKKQKEYEKWIGELKQRIFWETKL